jgi:hypothetical protein
MPRSHSPKGQGRVVKDFGVSLLLFMAKSRHKKEQHARRYFKPSAATMVEVTAILGPRNLITNSGPAHLRSRPRASTRKVALRGSGN